MSANLERARILFEQHRLDLAEGELRRALAADPDDPIGHALLALCHRWAERLEEATREAEEAVRLGPDLAFCHYVLARVLNDRGQDRQALAAAQEAIRLDPDDADYFALLASIHLGKERWQAGLEAADQGLEVDPEHDGCANLRALALTQLGKPEAAASTVEGVLARDPENPLSHATQGWAQLHRGAYDQALIHFREALRLDPMLDWAREGLVDALKARYPVYGLMLRYFLWMSRLSGKAQLGVIFGGMIGYQLVRGAMRANPGLAPLLTPLVVAYAVFVVLTWIADPLFNLLLRFNRFGRHALSDEQVVAANWVGGALAVACLAVAAAVLTRQPAALMAALVAGGLVLPLAGTFRCQTGWPRRAMAGITVALGLVGLAAVGVSVGQLWRVVPGRDAEVGLLGLFLLGVFASAWVANGLAMVTPRR